MIILLIPLNSKYILIALSWHKKISLKIVQHVKKKIVSRKIANLIHNYRRKLKTKAKEFIKNGTEFRKSETEKGDKNAQ